MYADNKHIHMHYLLKRQDTVICFCYEMIMNQQYIRKRVTTLKSAN